MSVENIVALTYWSGIQVKSYDSSSLVEFALYCIVRPQELCGECVVAESPAAKIA